MHDAFSRGYVLDNAPALSVRLLTGRSDAKRDMRNRWMFGIEPRTDETSGGRKLSPKVEGSQAHWRLSPDGYIGNIG